MLLLHTFYYPVRDYSFTSLKLSQDEDAMRSRERDRERKRDHISFQPLNMTTLIIDLLPYSHISLASSL